MTDTANRGHPDPHAGAQTESATEFGNEPRERRRVALLGSTGSIGTQALDVIARNPDRFEVVALAAGGSNLELLAQQALETRAPVIATSADAARELADRVSSASYNPQILTGPDAATDVAAQVDADVVLNGITGSIGLGPTLAALDAGRTLALANKESLIVGGELVTSKARPGQIVPVDSEHSAIAQCLRAGTRDEVRRLVLTASGGPFRGRTRAELANVTPAQALNHPTWSMGRMVTTNSATLVNKGLEVIEAHLLFDVPLADIDVVVHPQSIVHSMVEFDDGSTIAQCSPPDMRLPIALGLAWPDRVPYAIPGIDWTQAADWHFEPLDNEAFPAVELAKDAAKQGSTYPAVYNAANEEAVDAFHEGRIGFTDIVDTVERVVSEHTGQVQMSVDSVLSAEQWARSRAHEVIRESAP